MSIAAGTKLGRYEITSQLGVGGMGEVYLAQDTKLDRKVALKILPAEVASKQERMARFVREAKAAAALNHPNIAHIYEIGEEAGVHLIAMEFVDGQTLRQKIHREHADLRKLLRYLQQVAEGMAKAHAAGIVHRDLKPDNVMISRDGYAKILDFGLAKLVEPTVSMGQQAAADGGLSEVATAVMPQHSLPGTIMGTVGYMSPEQAQGRIDEIDHRSDIFSFGCILFEAATKRKAFEGKDNLDSLHNIVHAPTPQIKDLNPLAPAELQKIVRRCLAKDPERRYQSIKDVAIELDELRQELKEASELHDSVHQTEGSAFTASDQTGVTATGAQSAASSTQLEFAQPTSSSRIILNELARNKRGVALAIGVIIVVAMVGWLGWQKFRDRQPPRSAGEMKITRLVSGVGRISAVSVSPDGKYVAYAVYSQQEASLWVRQVSQETSVQIVAPVEDSWFNHTSFSPDGELIYFIGGNRKTNTLGSLFQVPVFGGRDPKKIVDHATSALALSPDGKQVAFLRYLNQTDESSLMITPVDGSAEPRKLASRRTTSWFNAFSWSPDGLRIVAAQASTTGGNSFTLVEIPVAGGPEKAVTNHKWLGDLQEVHWLSDGSGLVVAAEEKISDPSQYFLVSLPSGDVGRITSDLNEYGSFGITRDSSIIVANLSEGSSKIWIAKPGEEEGFARKISNGRLDGMAGVAWTPDGRIVYSGLAGENLNLWIMNADGTAAKQLTSHPFRDSHAAISPDGRHVVFQSSRPDNTPHIWRIDIDGGNLKQLTFTEDQSPSFSPDSKWVVFHSWRTGSPTLWRVPIEGGEQVQISSLRLSYPRVSADGKQILCGYYDESTNPPRERPARISAENGQLISLIESPPNAVSHRWSPNGQEFFYADTSKDVTNIWSQPVAGGAPKQLTRFSSDFMDAFDVSRDGKRLVVSRSTFSNEIVLIKDFK